MAFARACIGNDDPFFSMKSVNCQLQVSGLNRVGSSHRIDVTLQRDGGVYRAIDSQNFQPCYECFDLMKSFFAMCLLVLMLAPSSFAKNPPNVLVVITDEHNFRTLGCYRDQLSREQAEMWGPGVVVETPHIDRLASEGVICTRAYATSPVCTPSRAALITGLYPHHTGAPANNMELRTDIPTLATILNQAGYRSGFIGKWHLGGAGKPEWEPKIDGGFQDKSSMFNRGHWKKMRMTNEGPRVAVQKENGEFSYSLDGADSETFATDFLTDRAIEFIESSSDQPFLAVVSYPDPHGPNSVRPPYDHMYDDLRFLPPRTYGLDQGIKPGWLSGNNRKHGKFLGKEMSRYFGMVKCIDDNLGRLLETLSEQGTLDSTIILFTSDHGDLCYEHDRLDKGNPYEAAAGIPMLIRYPKKIEPGTVYKDPVGIVDVTPTILAMAGTRHEASFHGQDRSHWFSSTDQGDSPVVFLRNGGTTPQWIAAIDNRYKLILSVNDEPWLFDNATDPDELLNFYGRPGTQNVTPRLAMAFSEYAKSRNDAHFKNANIARTLRQCLGELAK